MFRYCFCVQVLCLLASAFVSKTYLFRLKASHPLNKQVLIMSIVHFCPLLHPFIISFLSSLIIFSHIHFFHSPWLARFLAFLVAFVICLVRKITPKERIFFDASESIASRTPMINFLSSFYCTMPSSSATFSSWSRARISLLTLTTFAMFFVCWPGATYIRLS